MADARATIVVEARDEATEAIKTLTGAVNDLNATIRESKTTTEGATNTNKQASVSWTDIAAQLYIVKNAVMAVVGVYNQLTAETIAVAAQQRDLARISGTTVEEAGKLIQAADDMTVSYGTVEAASRRMVMNGLSPSIDTIATLADQYVALKDPVERSQLLIENFGRGGLEMGKLLEKGGAGINALGDDAVAAGIVLSNDGVKAMREYEIATDNASDAILGMKMAIANELVPVVTDWINLVLKNVSIQTQLQAAYDQDIITLQELIRYREQLRLGLQSESDVTATLKTATLSYVSTQTAAINAVTNWRDETEKAVTFTEALAKADTALGKAAGEAAGELAILNAALSGGLGKESKEFLQTQDDLIQQQKDLTAELENYTAANGQAYGPAANLSQLQNEQALAAYELARAQDDLTKAQGSLTTSQMFGYGLDAVFEGQILSAKVAIDSKTAALDAANKAVTAASGGTANYGGKIEELKGKLGDVNAAIDANKKEHDIATKSILLGYAQQALAADGLSIAEIGYLTQLGEAWGVYDKGTAIAMQGVLTSVQTLNEEGDPKQFIESMDTVLTSTQNLGGTAQPLDTLTQDTKDLTIEQGYLVGGFKTTAKAADEETVPAVKALTTEVDLDVLAMQGAHTSWGIAYNDMIGLKGAVDATTKSVQDLNGALNNVPGHVGPYSQPGATSGTGATGHAMGADFIVPPGYLNDSYIMRVQSGEHVQVTPQGQRDPGGRATAAVNINGPILNNNVDVEILARRVAEYMTAAA